MPLMVRVAVPELVRVTTCAALVVPTVWLLKVRRVVDSVNFRGWFPLLGAPTAKIIVARATARAENLARDVISGMPWFGPRQRPNNSRIRARCWAGGT